MENLSVKSFVEKLASNEPIPGGGSIAGLAASLGSALSSMVFSLTVGKKIYRELSEDDKDKFDFCYSECRKYVDKFIKLMNDDASVFSEFIKVFSMPKETEEEKQKRNEAIEKGYEKAIKAPLETISECEKVYDLIAVAAEFGNKGVISDAAVSVIMLHAAVESSIINIKINLSGIKDDKLKSEVLNKCQSVLKVGEIKKSRIMNMVEERLK